MSRPRRSSKGGESGVVASDGGDSRARGRDLRVLEYRGAVGEVGKGDVLEGGEGENSGDGDRELRTRFRLCSGAAVVADPCAREPDVG
jgi:hypothetical protein